MNEAIFYLLRGLRDLSEHALGANTVPSFQVSAGSEVTTYNMRHPFSHLQESTGKEYGVTLNEFVSLNENEVVMTSL